MNKRSLLLLLTVIIFAGTGLFSCSGPHSGKRVPAPKAVGGILDLRNWDPAEQGPIPLDGQWEFYWKKILGPEDFSKGLAGGPKDTLNVPGVWNGHLVGGQKIYGSGFATYRLRVLMKSNRERMAFKFMSLGTAFSLSVNGSMLTSAGTVGTTPETSMPEWSPQVVGFSPEDGPLDIILQVSNFHHRKGGATESIWFGREADIWSMREKNVAFQLFLCGSLFIIGLYHLVIFFLRRKERAFLYFGLLSVLVAFYTLLAGERYIVHLLPGLSWEWRVKWTNLSSFLSVPCFLLFSYSLFPQDSRKGVIGGISGAIGLLCLLIMVTPAIVYSKTIPIFHILTLVGGLYTLILFSQAVLRKREGSALLSVGVLILIASLINDILYDNSLINTGQSIYLGLFLIIFLQSFVLSLRYAKAFTTVEKQRREQADANKVLEREMHERLKAEKALGESEKKYRQLMEEAPIGLWNIDLQARILYANRRFEEISGYSREELIGKNGLELELLTDENRAIIVDRMGKRLAGGPQIPVEIELVRKDGEQRWVELVARVMEDDGRPSGFQVGANDITVRKQAQKELQEAHDNLEKRVGERTAALDRTNRNLRAEIAERERTERQLKEAKETAEAASRSKSDFLANMSHELRTPLNHIIGFGELLYYQQVGSLKPTQSEYLNDILQSARHLLSLINDVLDLSRVEAGKMEVDWSSVDPRPLLENCIMMVKEKAHQHGIKLETEFNDLPEEIRADDRKLKQVLYNLLANAVKFTPDGGLVCLKANRVRSSESKDRGGKEFDFKKRFNGTGCDGDFIQISVTDTGIGLKPDSLDRIFLPFEQADGYISRKYQGTGLGLALTQKMVSLQGGTIWAESQGEGKGSTFHFVLPLRKS